MIVNRIIASCGFEVKVGVHVGAHAAQEAARYEALRVQRLVWVEADDSALELARATLAALRPGATTHSLVQALITDRDGVETEFHVFNNKGASSSIFRGTERLRAEWPKLRETGEIKLLRSARLDTLLAGLSIPPAEVGMLVFDTQGAELLCLRGAGAYLEAAVFVEVEMSQEAIYEGGALSDEVDALLVGQGLTRVTDIPWHGDAVYVRLDRLSAAERAGLQRFIDTAA